MLVPPMMLELLNSCWLKLTLEEFVAWSRLLLTILNAKGNLINNIFKFSDTNNSF